jgi:hypothetical protein
LENNIEDMELFFSYDKIIFGKHVEIELIEGGS